MGLSIHGGGGGSVPRLPQIPISTDNWISRDIQFEKQDVSFRRFLCHYIFLIFDFNKVFLFFFNSVWVFCFCCCFLKVLMCYSRLPVLSILSCMCCFCCFLFLLFVNYCILLNILPLYFVINVSCWAHHFQGKNGIKIWVYLHAKVWENTNTSKEHYTDPAPIQNISKFDFSIERQYLQHSLQG